MRLAILLFLFTTLLFGVRTTKIEPIQTVKLSDGTMLVKIALNYENTSFLSQRVRGTDGIHSVKFPIPGNWKVLSANGYIKYYPSILLLKEQSSGSILFNDILVEQFMLFNNMGTGVNFEIPTSHFREYNTLKLEMIQHYTQECEDSANSQLWTDINLKDSYIEFHIQTIAIPEEVQSLTTHMLDKKQYDITPINYVLSNNPTDDELRHYTLFTAATANYLEYRIAPITVSNKIDNKSHNVIIATKENAKKKLKDLNFNSLFRNDPFYSMHFNENRCEAWLSKDRNITLNVSKEGIEIRKRGAFSGKSLYLNGGKLTLNNLPTKDKDSVTVAFWFKPKIHKKAVLFGFEKYDLVLSNSSIGFSVKDKDLYGSRLALDNKWHHIVARFNTKNIKNNAIYIDGRKLSLQQLIGSSSTRKTQLSEIASLGGRLKDTRYSFNGNIDQFYIFDKPLTSIFISKFYRDSKSHKLNDEDESLFISEKIAHDINVLRNPSSPDKAILVIAPKDFSNINKVLYAFYKDDLSLYFRQGLDINSVKIPEKATAYSAKDYIPVDEKIYFKELGYETTVLKGWYPPSISIDFKVYPDHYFDEKDRIETQLNYVFPTTVNKDSVANIFLNEKFAKQIDIMGVSESSTLSLKTGGLFDWSDETQLPVYLINKGYNKFKFEFSLVPDKAGSCKLHNTQNLLAMVMDNSYFILPDSKRWIEMPYMQHIAMSTYPYSIYPDLQDTQFIVSNTDSGTISSLMNFTFFMVQELQSYPYYVNVTKDVKKADKSRHLILFGSIHDKDLQELSSQAPVVLSGTNMNRSYPFIKEFTEHMSIADSDRTIKHKYTTNIDETNQLDKNILMQMYRSPFDEEKTVLMFGAENGTCLNHGVNSLLSYENRHFIKGDTLIYNSDAEEGISYNIQEKYILTSMNWIDKISLQLSMNPIFYMFVLFFIILLLTLFARRLLATFKKRKHKHVE